MRLCFYYQCTTKCRKYLNLGHSLNSYKQVKCAILGKVALLLV